jgi:hypothetical protein
MLDKQDFAIRCHEMELAKLRDLKSGLTFDLLTGRVRVPEDSGVRRHDAALPLQAAAPDASPTATVVTEQSGDTSPHSKGGAA